MEVEEISLIDFTSEGRKAVLDALDTFVQDKLQHPDARGWIDAELPQLFEGIDTHLRAVADRVNSGGEPGSVYVTVKIVE